MAKRRDLLEAMATSEEVAKAAGLATEIRAGENTLRIRLAPLKHKGYVDDQSPAVQNWPLVDAFVAAFGFRLNGQPNLMGRWRQWVNWWN